MKNIVEILASIGLAVPEEKQAELNKAVAENYKTVAEHEKKLGRLEAERDSWKEKAETAETTLKGFDGVDVEKIRSDLESWKTKAENAQKEYDAKLYQRDFDDALRTALDGVKFSSGAAKKSVEQEIRAAGLKLSEGKIMGLNDMIEQIKSKDASAFVDEKQAALEASKAKFTQRNPAGQQSTGALTRDQIMAIKDRVERRAAIAANQNLFGGTE